MNSRNAIHSFYLPPIGGCSNLESESHHRRIPSFSELIKECSIPSIDSFRYYPFVTAGPNHIDKCIQCHPGYLQDPGSAKHDFHQTSSWAVNSMVPQPPRATGNASLRPAFTDKKNVEPNNHPMNFIQTESNSLGKKPQEGKRKEPKQKLHHQSLTYLQQTTYEYLFSKLKKSKSGIRTAEKRPREKSNSKSTSKSRREVPHALYSKQSPRPYRRHRYLNKELCMRNNTKCSQCGSTRTPEWRSGPEGNRTLCNACGLLFTKLTKKMGWEAARNDFAKQKELGKLQA